MMRSIYPVRRNSENPEGAGFSLRLPEGGVSGKAFRVAYPCMGGDGELAGQFVVLSTVASVVTIFLWVYFLNSIGWLA
jgi:hypothetical protein